MSGSDESSKFAEPQSEPLFVAIPSEEKEFQDAYARALETIPVFQSLLTEPGARIFSVKLRFRDPQLSDELGEDRFMFLWLTSVYYHEAENVFSAEFFEVPDALQEWHHVGQRLAFEAEDIFDWMVNDDGYVHGGFTLRVVKKHLSEADRAAHDEFLGVETWAPLPSNETEIEK